MKFIHLHNAIALPLPHTSFSNGYIFFLFRFIFAGHFEFLAAFLVRRTRTPLARGRLGVSVLRGQTGSETSLTGATRLPRA